MAEIVGISGLAGRRAAPGSWLRHIVVGLVRPFRRHDLPSRIDERQWSDYMLRDIGLGADAHNPDPRDFTRLR